MKNTFIGELMQMWQMWRQIFYQMSSLNDFAIIGPF